MFVLLASLLSFCLAASCPLPVFSRDFHRYISQNKKVYPLGLVDPPSIVSWFTCLIFSPGDEEPTYRSKWSSFRHSGEATTTGSKQMGLARLVLTVEQFTHLE
ncbi:unnamed protein product [Dicrocoelium dendriticum]|nr:unnamed protein product [Dicrocoelium dendriticum]